MWWHERCSYLEVRMNSLRQRWILWCRLKHTSYCHSLVSPCVAVRNYYHILSLCFSDRNSVYHYILYIGVEQNNGNITDTVHISLLILCWTTGKSLQYSCSPSWNGLVQFWTVSSGVVYLSPWRTSSSFFRDVGGGNLFLTLVSKTDQSGSVVFKSGDYAGQGLCWISPSFSSNHDWTVLGVWMETLSSWKAASLFGNNVRIMGCDWLPNLSKYSFAVIRPWRVIMGPTEHCTTLFTPKPSQNLPRVSLLETGMQSGL
jgi:hypothetical protein